MEPVEASVYARETACEAYSGVQRYSSYRTRKPASRLAFNWLGQFGAARTDPAVAAAYGTLRLPNGAPLSVVKSSYRTLATRWHPDVGGDAPAMIRLNQAYGALRLHLGG